MFSALFPQTKQQSFHKQSDDALHRIVILRCNDTTGWPNLLLPCNFQELLKSAKCGIYFIENSWRLQWTWSSSESTFCHFYYTVYRVYTSIARKSITLKSTLKAHLIIISGQHGHFIITSTQLICTSYAGPWWQYIHHQRYLIHRVVLWDAKLSHVMADYFLFIRFFRVNCFFIEQTFDDTGMHVRYSHDVNMYIHVTNCHTCHNLEIQND